tara:strand:+ start:257 stop:490 length:234 start_codon:yes stop_codon:yes gene_type:complete
MTQDEVIRFAIQCRLVTTGNRDGLYMDALTEFAKLVAAKEREACAEVCDELHWPWHIGDNSGPKQCAIAIRARGEQA